MRSARSRRTVLRPLSERFLIGARSQWSHCSGWGVIERSRPMRGRAPISGRQGGGPQSVETIQPVHGTRRGERTSAHAAVRAPGRAGARIPVTGASLQDRASLLLIERRRRPRSVPARQAHCASQLCQLTLCGSSPTGQFVDLDDDTVMPIELHHHEALGVDLSHVRRVIRSSRTTKPTNGARRSSADQATAHSKKHPVGVACVGQRWVRKRAHRHSQEEDHQPTAEGHVTGRAQHKRARHGRSSQEPASKCPLMPRSAVPV